MIIAIVGTVGSGKTLSVVRKILRRKQLTFCNFSVNCDNVVRLKQEHIVNEVVVGQKKNGDDVKEKRINWDFWNDTISVHDGFDIVLDEVHNIIHSRLSMSKNNVLMTMWFSQIRKILGTSERNHIFLITQKLSRIDVAFRDLLDVVIYCKKEVRGDRVFIHQFVFRGDNCLDDFYVFRANPKLARNLKMYRRNFFCANSYFPFYDSYELVRFGESAYL